MNERIFDRNTFNNDSCPARLQSVSVAALRTIK